MLVLSRKPLEKIMIGKDVTLTILSINGKSIKLGFEAPTDVEIDREEIFEKKLNEYKKKVA